MSENDTGPRLFDVAAQRVRELHLTRRPALGLEEPRACHEDAGAPRARRGHVQPVQAVQELHPARRLLGTRRRHRVDDHRRLLPLELVDRANANPTPRESLGQERDVGVVRGDDEYVRRGHRPRGPLGVDPGPGTQDRGDGPVDRLDFLDRAVAVPLVLDGHDP